MDDLLQSLRYALETYPERVEALPIAELVLDSARQNERRPAYVKLAVPDALVKQLRGHRDESDLTLLVHIPREVLKRKDSLILLPGEVR